MTSPTIDRRQGLVGNTPIKAPVACATTGPITLSGEQTIDGVVTSSSRVLVKNQANQSQNGIYDTNSAAWTRSRDADGSFDLAQGTIVFVNGGAVNSFSLYNLTTASPVIGSTVLVWRLLASLVGGVSVRWFGAAGDGVTDDTSAVQAAITYVETQNLNVAGGGRPPVNFDSGVFLVGTLTLNRMTRIAGAGSGSTFLQLKSGVTTSMFVVNAEDVAGTSIDDADHVQFTGMSMLGNRVDTTTVGVSHGIYCPDTAWLLSTQYSTSIRGSDLKVQFFTGCGLYFGANRNWALLDRVIVRYCNDAAHFTKGYDGRYTACDFGTSTGYGIREAAGGANVFIGCNIYFNGVNIQIDPFTNSFSTWQGCSIDGALTNGVNNNGATAAKKFIGCRFFGNSRAGAGLWSDIIVSGAQAVMQFIGCDFTLSGQATKLLIESNGNTPITWIGNNYLKFGASVPYVTAVTNWPTSLTADTPYINVMVFGAVGDGVTDDSAAIQAAINFCQTGDKALWFPGAVYVCAAALSITSSIRILSEGAQLKFTTLGAATDCLVINASCSAGSPVDIENIQVFCNSVGRDGIVVGGGTSGADFLRIEGVQVTGCVRDGIRLQPQANNCWIQNFIIRNSKVLSPGRHGISIIAPALTNVFVNQGTIDNVDIRGAGQTVGSSYDLYMDCQGAPGQNQKISEICVMNCDFDAAGAASHAQGSVFMGMSGTYSSYAGFTFPGTTFEDTGAVIAGFPFAIQVQAGATVIGIDGGGGVISKYGQPYDVTKVTGAHRWLSGTASRSLMTLDGLITGAGLVPGQTAIAATNVLDWYEESTFTPAITLGGAAVGVTYSVQDGAFTRIGNRINFTIVLVLTSKGSSVGSLLVTGLPYASAQSNGVAFAGRMNNMAVGLADIVPFGSGTTSIRIDKFAAGACTQLADTDLTNTSDIRISGSYKA